MFGNRLKTWMENYIGRPRKKDVQKEKCKTNDGGGVTLESSESLVCSDAGISSGSQQVLSSSGSDNREGYSTTTMESEKSGITHCHTTVSLPSPESAYSTGYSTDGASPGGTGPPEYYINIRTGKHYFPSPAPTPTSPQPNSALFHLHPTNHRLSTTSGPGDFSHSVNPVRSPRTECKPEIHENSRDPTFIAFPGGVYTQLGAIPREFQVPSDVQTTLSTSVPSYFEILNFSKSPTRKSFPMAQLTPIKLFLKSPKHDKGKPKPDVNKTLSLGNKKKVSSTGKSKKWFKQPFHKFGHRRTDSYEENAGKNEPKREIHLENLRYLLGQENSASPRQRNRIKTNPWLPTEPLSSHNFHTFGIGFSPSLTRNRSCSNTPLQNRRTTQMDFVSNHVKQSDEKNEDSNDHVNKCEKKLMNRGASGKFLGTELSDHSDEDLTLNEVMGTYNESYFYEKETDILSDSDPTDCEDYGTDSEADNGGDERDSHDDELDFIDNGSASESDDSFPQNTGKCTYYDSHCKRNSFLWKNNFRHFRRDSESRKTVRKDHNSKLRREKRRQSRKSLNQEGEEKSKPKVEINENVGGLNLSRVLTQRMMEKCSKSAEGTPVGVRRQKLTSDRRESQGGVEKENMDGKKSGVREGLNLIDFEADNRYNELIKEAESIIESLRNSPIVINRKEMISLEVKDDASHKTKETVEAVEMAKKAKTRLCPRGGSKEPERLPNKSPKNLALKLSMETPKKFKRLDFGVNEQSSFKKRSSAHSPLDPLGPTLRNFAVFKPSPCDNRKVSMSSSDDSVATKASEEKGSKGQRCGIPESPMVPIAFQSVDLGKTFASYCPQSEPVKRKIYSCSKTYDQLVKRFENEPTIFEETKNGQVGNGLLGTKSIKSTTCRVLETCIDGNQGFLTRERRRDRNFPAGAPRRPSYADLLHWKSHKDDHSMLTFSDKTVLRGRESTRSRSGEASSR